MRMPWEKKEKPKVQRPIPKKGKCIITFKKTPHGEKIEFTQECKPEQIEYAKQMREEKLQRGE